MVPITKVQALRPASVRSHPVRLDKVFDKPAEVLRLLESGAPYPTTAKLHNLGETMGAAAARAPWFKDYLDDPVFLDNPHWIEAARQAFSAGIVRPVSAMVNLNAATPLGVPHLDLPQFRGVGHDQAPVWLLLNMAHSGLFHDWMVPYASGLAWFYGREDGGFEYWPGGLEAGSVVEPGPMYNRGVVSDNEFMWHRVGAIGTQAEQEEISALMRYAATLHHVAGGGWEIRDGEEILARLTPDRIRISILWKAQVFTDEAHLASFEDERFDLSLEQVTEIYLADLDSRAEAAAPPRDPLADDWRKLLQATYSPALDLLLPG